MPLTFKDVRKIALSLANVEEGTSYGTPAFKVDGRLLARLREDRESLVVGTTFEEREEMMAAEPDTYCITEHYLKYPWVLVRLSRVHSDSLRDLLSRALRLASVKPRRASVRRRLAARSGVGARLKATRFLTSEELSAWMNASVMSRG